MYTRLKSAVEICLIYCLQFNFFWIPLQFLIKVSLFCKRMRYAAVVQSNRVPSIRGNHLLRHFPKPIVMHGPFKGTLYPRYESCGSLLCPKLLGSYEYEIQSVAESFLQGEYQYIWDIGCAEGYYAIGFARRIPTAEIVAFDTDPKARLLCAEMAKLNDVFDRVEIRDFCSPNAFAELHDKSSLIICDCEGYEHKLFNAKSIQHLKHCDLLIETHDFLGVEIASHLETLLSATHLVHRVSSIDDIVKASSYSFPETVSFSFKDKIEVFAEGRQHQMDWLVCRSKVRSH